MPQTISETPVTATEQPIVEEQTEAQNVVSLDTKKVTEQYSIQMTEAHQSALLKGEFYDKTFHLHLSDPVVKSSATKEIANKKAPLKTTSVSASNSLLKLTQPIPGNQPEIENDKPKRTFKKVVKPFSNNNGLSEAIVASGNKPIYPKQAIKEKLQGTVTVKFIVSTEGESQSPKMVKSSGHKILDTTVLDFVKKERFMPSFDGVEKVTKEQQFTHKFVTQE
ncbi:energy transducer TonB [Psychromonas sp. KJ10-10]|uniref:energy transducer TonB n=1 Tax=Psychromonas sp. KJ10-10 TaxID=3391823 RepID=UPI0039B6A83A